MRTAFDLRENGKFSAQIDAMRYISDGIRDSSSRMRRANRRGEQTNAAESESVAISCLKIAALICEGREVDDWGRRTQKEAQLSKK